MRIAALPDELERSDALLRTVHHTHMQEKSRLDWVSYKRDEGLEEELSQHKKDGYAMLHM